MLSLIIRYFFLIFCVYYIYCKLLHVKRLSKSKLLICFFSILFNTSLLTLPTIYTAPFRLILMFVLCFLFLTFFFTIEIYLSLTYLLISLGLSYTFLVLSTLVNSIVFFALYQNASNVPYLSARYSIAVLQFLIMYYVFKSKRLNTGISKLIQKNSSRIGVIISALLAFCIICTAFFTKDISNYSLLIRSILLILLPFFLLYYWRHRITQTYLERMRRLEVLNYENTITDKDKHIKELEDNNAYLGRIIHKYRKIIPAMEISVMELLQNNEGLDASELKHKAESLQLQLDEIHAERDNLFDNYQKQAIASTQTGLHTIDAMLALMEKRAKQDWIRYKMQIAPDIKELSLNSIKETDLLHLLGDLIENAIHAVNATDTKDILIHIGKLNNCLLLEVSDSGVPFDIHTYQNFGNEAYTTHTEDGGTGTGLMDIWSIKKKYKASLYIYEYETSSNNIFTKKISFLFDGKNHFLLKTYRDKEIKNSLIRGDLHVFPHETE